MTLHRLCVRWAEQLLLMLLRHSQDIGLDTAFLPSLSELVSTARLAKIPQQGPGSITSLCLLDQTVASREHLACLSQLSSLAG